MADVGLLALAKEYADKVAKEMLLTAHPVGSLYWSSDATSPADLFGGTWERVKDTFILAAGDDFAAGDTGGEVTHKLTTEELPAHTHGSKELKGSIVIRALDSAGTVNKLNSASGILGREISTNSDKWYDIANRQQISGQYDKLTVDATHTHSSVGSDVAHNNMPPYEVYYCWKRIS